MPELSNPFGAMGGEKKWNGVDTEFKAGTGGCTTGLLVSLGVDGSVINATTSVASSLIAGVALNDAAAGETCRVRTQGLAYVAGNGTIAAGNVMVRDGSTTAGNVIAASAATGTQGQVGVAVQALSADKTGYVLVNVCPVAVRIS